MRICLLGENRGNLDEGMRNITFHFAHLLSNTHQILVLDLRDFISKKFWKNLSEFNPEIIHYVHGPSFRSFLFAKFLSYYCRDAKIIVSAMRPYLPHIIRHIIPLVKPDLVLTQSSGTEEMFKHLGIRTEFLPSGVDIEKFAPITKENEINLRKKYGLKEEKFIILHIGSLKEGRNIELLNVLQSTDNLVLILGSTSTGKDKKLYQKLKESGCILWLTFMNSIEEIYALADCYFFPTVERHDYLGRSIADSIEMPLTVLEAMASNLPVITTKFGALPKVFEQGDGLFFVENVVDISNSLTEIKKGVEVRTREKVLPYSWINVVKKLETIYSNLLGANEL
ncbi:MAG TPA: glycosyltransferase [Proteobacteria bacterium]|nr:glycosyltransferase [Pseudomonadota bacterium]